MSDKVRVTPIAQRAKWAQVRTEHDDKPQTLRVFPQCRGTTRIAPANAQCLTCGLYGQRCDREAL